MQKTQKKRESIQANNQNLHEAWLTDYEPFYAGGP